ncbi:ABC transporter permease subunit [Escherichia coli]
MLGYGGFYAIGAYTFALLNHYYGLGFWTCLPIAGLMAAAAGFLLDPVLRLRGDYLAIVTLGFGEIVRILLLNNAKVPAARTVSVRSRNRLSSALSSAVPPAKAAGTRSVISLA